MPPPSKGGHEKFCTKFHEKMLTVSQKQMGIKNDTRKMGKYTSNGLSGKGDKYETCFVCL